MTSTLQLTFQRPEWAKEFLDDLNANKPCNEHGDNWEELYGTIQAGFVPDKPETPEEGMKREMLDAIRGVVGENGYGSIFFNVVQFTGGKVEAKYSAFIENLTGDIAATTLAEAIRNIPTTDKIKQQRIDELEKELAKLKEAK